MYLLQLVTLFICSIGICSLVKKPFQFFAALALALFFNLQFLSFYINGTFINDQFLLHLHLEDIGSVMGNFYTEAILLLIGIGLLTGLNVFLAQLIQKQAMPKPTVRYLAIAGMLAILFLPKGILNTMFSSSLFDSKTDVVFDQALRETGIDPFRYIKPSDVRATAGKNIIVIYLESMELGFLEGSLKPLTPNLNKLRQEMNFYTMPQDPGSDWSAAAIYTGLSGIPAFFSFGSGGNRIFQKTKSTTIAGVGHVLEKAGYQRQFLLGKKEFSGLDEMLIAQRFQARSEVDFDQKYPSSPWGLHDLDLFNEAKKAVRAYKKSSQPFALYLATIGTHAPDGIYDPRIEGFVPSQESQLKRMVRATDQMIGDFIEFLKEEQMMDNTTLYILPDHLLMGSQARIVNEFSANRSLYLLTNSQAALPPKVQKRGLHQIDLPQVILTGANVKHNALFLTDFIEKQDIEGALLEQKKSLQQVNESAVRGDNFQNGFTVQFGGNTLMISSDEHQVPIKWEGAEDQVLCVQLDHKFRIQSHSFTNLYQAFNVESIKNGPVLVIDKQDEQWYGALRYGDKKIVSKMGTSELSFSGEDIQLLRSWPYSKDLYELPPNPQYLSSQPTLYVTSSASGNPQLRHPTAIRLDHMAFPIQRSGLYLYQNEGVSFYKPDASGINNLYNQVSALIQKGSFFVLLKNQCESIAANKSMAQLFPRLNDIPDHWAYIAYGENGSYSEHSDPRTLSFSFPITTVRPNKQQDIARWRRDRSRFIAHAGGAIDGLYYTNSLEALNQSYANGFRYFELDILQTTDGHFVAAHDWVGWKQKTKYAGNTPVSLEVFKRNPLHGTYAPLDMPAINDWFKNHPDAYLVTDKINNPVAFSKAFIDPKRLIMELFSWDAVEQGARIKELTVMPSEGILKEKRNNLLTVLQNYQIDRITISRRSLQQEKGFYNELARAGIKIFVYHLNQYDYRDEQYVLQYDFPVAYGMYADYWSFD